MTWGKLSGVKLRLPPTAILCLAIGPERFAFYAMLGCLVSWLGDGSGSDAYGNMVAAAYLAPLFGGYVGGRLGLRRTAMAGALMLAAGYALLCALTVAHASPIPAMALVAAGCGLFKPNLTTLLVDVVPPARRLAATGRLYFAINLGALPSTLVAIWLHHRFGWAAVWGSCAAAAASSAVVLALGRRRLLSYTPPVEDVFTATVRAAIAPAAQSWRPWPLSVLLVGSAMFFACFYQQGTTLMVWAKHAAGMRDPEALQTFNSLFVLAIALSPIAAWQSSLRWRCALGLVLMTAAFAVLRHGGAIVPAPALAVVWFAIGSVSEVMISPLGMGIAPRYVPQRWAPVATAAFFVSIAAGGKIAGVIGGLPLSTSLPLSTMVGAAGALWFALFGGALDEARITTAEPTPGDLVRVKRVVRLGGGEMLLPGMRLRARLHLSAQAWLCRRRGVDYVVPLLAVEVL